MQVLPSRLEPIGQYLSWPVHLHQELADPVVIDVVIVRSKRVFTSIRIGSKLLQLHGPCENGTHRFGIVRAGEFNLA